MRQLVQNMNLQRRSLLNCIFFFSLIILLINNRVSAQNELDVIKDNWLEFSDAQNSLYHHLTGQAYDFLAQREEKIASLTTLEDWQQYQKLIQKTLLDIVGPFPEKTPLKAKITRVIEKDSFRVEHIVFESQPGFYVTSSLFIPTWFKGKVRYPAVIFCSGHSDNGYRYNFYQYTILNLVKKGFIVYAFDPVGQGERLEYYDPATKKSLCGPTIQHSYPGSQAFITGSSQARYMIWDGIRAVDYLLSRKEVDPARIGITGRSGGGTQSAYIAAFDGRISASAPECYITNFKRLLQTIGNQDAEQNLAGQLAKGIDQGDLFLVRAPKPSLMITTTRDMFSIQGARETEKEVSSIYKAYGKENDFSCAEDDTSHASTRKNREAMYAFFQKYLDNPGNSADVNVTPLTPEEIQVTPTGQVSTSYKCETVFSLNRKESEKLSTELSASRKNLIKFIPEAINSAKRLSGYKTPDTVFDPVFTGRFRREGYVIEKYFLKGEGNYPIPYLLFIPDNRNNKALIYLHPEGKSTEAMAGGEIEWFVNKGFIVLAPDQIGTGETGPGVFQGDAFIDGDSHNLWYASILIGRSIVGIRAGDVVRLTSLLKKVPGISEIYGLARKEMSPVLLHAAAFDEDITRVALVESYSSYQSIVMNHLYKSSFISGVVPGALREYDLPDLAAGLVPRKLLIAGVTDGSGKITDTVSINKDLAIIKTSYKTNKVSEQLSIVPLTPGEKLYSFFSDWIK